MEVKYTIHYQEQVIRKHIPELPVHMKNSIKHAILERLVVDPVGFGKPLQYSLRGHRRLRVGNYRVIYRIDAATATVTIIAIKHRKEAYI